MACSCSRMRCPFGAVMLMRTLSPACMPKTSTQNTKAGELAVTRSGSCSPRRMRSMSGSPPANPALYSADLLVANRLIRPPQRRGSEAAPRAIGFSSERIDRNPVVPDGQMEMGKLGHARKPDQSDRRAAVHPVAWFDAHASAPEVAVLRLPAAVMLNDDAVSAFPRADTRPRSGISQRHVVHSVADVAHYTGCARHHWHAFAHHAQVANRDIDAIVPVVRPGTTAKVPCRLRRIRHPRSSPASSSRPARSARASSGHPCRWNRLWRTQSASEARARSRPRRKARQACSRTRVLALRGVCRRGDA